MKTLTWQKPGQQNVAQELIKIIINYVAELRFIILLLMGMGTTLTGLVINYKTVTICGTLGALSSIGCLFYEGFNQVLIFAPVFIFMMIIPGHVLNHAARKQKKL